MYIIHFLRDGRWVETKILIMTQLTLTHLWIDNGLLLANDRIHGLLVLTTEHTFNTMTNDSLKRNWAVNRYGVKYRKIRAQKRCYIATPIEALKECISDTEIYSLVQASFYNTY
jgi:hypothetical protein